MHPKTPRLQHANSRVFFSVFFVRHVEVASVASSWSASTVQSSVLVSSSGLQESQAIVHGRQDF